jgi:hypothetical protein
VPLVTAHVVFDGIPAVASVAEYGEPTAAGAREVVAIEKRRPQTSKVKSVSALLFSQSFTASQTLNVPSSVAIPLTRPVWSFSWVSARPGGNPPERITRWCGRHPA